MNLLFLFYVITQVKTIWKIGSRKRENTMDHQSKNAWVLIERRIYPEDISKPENENSWKFEFISNQLHTNMKHLNQFANRYKKDTNLDVTFSMMNNSHFPIENL
uniref:Uncharacterized protein n=1 Tax=Cucumis melo TaxID=3656 RepID=A0A9I9E8M3_CUCME